MLRTLLRSLSLWDRNPRYRQDMFDLMNMSLDDLSSHLLAIGGTGSGKTSKLRLTPRDAFRRGGDQIGALWAGVKPDEYANALAVVRSAGCEDRLLHLKPGNGFTYNFLAYELNDRPGGNAVTATNLLQDLNRQLNASKGESDDFWANLFGRKAQCGITIAHYALRDRVTIEAVYQLILSAPVSFEQVASDAFRAKSYCFDLLKRAESNVANADEHRQLKQAATFFLSEAIQLGDKARQAAVSQVIAVLTPFLQEPLYSVVNATRSTFKPTMPNEGYIAMMDAPVMVLGDAGRFFQTLVTTQVIEASLARTDTSCLTLIIRDELQKLIGDANKEAMWLSVARSTRTAFVAGVQSIPTLQSAMGGNRAEQELHSLLANYSTKCVLSNPCKVTNSYFSDAWGEHREEFLSVSENKSEEDWDLLNMITGNDRLVFSMSEQVRPRCPIESFSKLRRGGPVNDWLIDFFLTQSGRTYGPAGAPFKRVTFTQELL